MRYEDRAPALGDANLCKNGEGETMTEHFLQRNLGAAVFVTAELKIFESICGGSKWSLAPIPKLSRKRMPFDRRVLFQL
jgi:hypothetical protein